MKQFICLFRGHKYHVIKQLSKNSRKLGCERCNKEFAMNDELQVILPWSLEFEDFYKEFSVL